MDNKNFLISIYQNTSTALQSIKNMYPKFRNPNLKDLMKKQEEGYRKFNEDCKKLAHSKNLELKDNNVFEKCMLWTSINMSCIKNKTSSHIAELFLVGTVRGTIELYKILKSNPEVDDEIKELAKNLLQFEEDSFNEIKMFLKE